MNVEKVLPPGVSGKISGYLTIKVDEVFWTRSAPGEVIVELIWWGENEGTFFRPEDITQKDGIAKHSSSATYTIRTSPGLFETYLRNCGKVQFTIIRGANKNVIVGTSVVQDIYKIMTEKTLYSYFPIFDPKGLRLGDLHVCFEVKFLRKQSHYVPKSKHGDLIRRSKGSSRNRTSESSTTTSQGEVLQDILKKGNELRKAMVMSVISDCPVDKLDHVINENFMQIKESKTHRHSPGDVKLVDFLLGKDMTDKEEREALELLRCTSADEKLKEIAESVAVPKVTKSTCCGHGGEGDKGDWKSGGNRKKDAGVKRSESSSAAPSSHLSSPPATPSQGNALRPGIRNSTVSDAVDTRSKRTESSQDTIYNGYRIIIKTLTLSTEGWRKICPAPIFPELANRPPGHTFHPPGTTYILEIGLPSKGTCERHIKFTTKKCREKVVIFAQGSSHKLCGKVSWRRVKDILNGSTLRVTWRHLNQRVPCPLGTACLDLPESCQGSSVVLSLPLYSNTRLLTATLCLSVQLAAVNLSSGEAFFHLNEDSIGKEPSLEFIEERTSEDEMEEQSAQKVRSEGEGDPNRKISSEDSSLDGQEIISQLDKELLRTIQLLNSKPGEKECEEGARADIEGKPPNTAPSPPARPPTSSRTRNASVQVSLPLLPREQPSQSTISSREIPHTSLGRRQDGLETDRSEGGDRGRQLEADSRRHPYPEKFHHTDPTRLQVTSTPPEEPTSIETIHEFTVKLEKVVGVPLFTGDNDLDCFLNYSFPKVDENGIVMLDEGGVSSDAKVALSVTEFGTTVRHRMRLRYRLRRALLSLPPSSQTITFHLWAKTFKPSSAATVQCLATARLPVSELCSLEVKYEEGRGERAVWERFVLRLTPEDSPLTTGYVGYFGELHVTIGYSKASGLSYREWRCKVKDDHYWCRPDGCLASSRNPPYYERSAQREPLSTVNDRHYGGGDYNTAYLNSYMTGVNHGSSSRYQYQEHCTNKEYTGSMDRKYDSQPISKDYNQPITSDYLPQSHPDPISRLHSHHSSSYPEEKYLYSRHFETNYLPYQEYGKQENIVKKVLKEIQERKAREKALLQSTKTNHSTPNEDAFNSFNLRVDLPKVEDTSDFEMKSQYSFLKTPNGEPSFVNKCAEFESTSSLLKETLANASLNPFSSPSNLSLSSDCSMFKSDAPQGTVKDTGKENLPPTERLLLINSSGSSKVTSRGKKTDPQKEDKEESLPSSNETLKSVESLKSFKEAEAFLAERAQLPSDKGESFDDKNYFKARVAICRALGLPCLEVKTSEDKVSLVKPTSQAYFTGYIAGKQSVLKTRIVEKNSNPSWNSAWEVHLPVQLLKKSDRELEIFVEVSGENGAVDGEEAGLRRLSEVSSHWPLILRAGVDLTVLAAGLDVTCGWYSLTDRALLSRAQIQVIVTPLEDISSYRKDWIDEYTKTKRKHLELPSTGNSTSIATSLQEKLRELERLTDGMKSKLRNRERWDLSPPISLLHEVQAKSPESSLRNLLGSGILEDDGPRPEARGDKDGGNRSDQARTKDLVSPEQGSSDVLDTYTVSEVSDGDKDSEHEDSLETPSQTINRLITKVRNNR